MEGVEVMIALSGGVLVHDVDIDAGGESKDSEMERLLRRELQGKERYEEE